MQLRKEALVGAINDLTTMHAMATRQKELLEEAAFVSVCRRASNQLRYDRSY